MKIIAAAAYQGRVVKLLTDLERRVAEDMIAADPLRWPVIVGTGGVRKARIARGHSGKSGGARIAYFVMTSADTLHLLAIYAKNEKENMSQAERNAMRDRVKRLLKESRK